MDKDIVTSDGTDVTYFSLLYGAPTLDALQDRLGIWWTRNTPRNVKSHTRNEEGILIILLTSSCKLSSIKQLANR